MTLTKHKSHVCVTLIFFFFLLSQKLAEAWEMKSVRLRGGGLDRLRKASFKKKKKKRKMRFT